MALYAVELEGLRRRPTYDELVYKIREGQEKIKLPNRYWTQLARSPQLNLFDQEGVAEIEAREEKRRENEDIEREAQDRAQEPETSIHTERARAQAQAQTQARQHSVSDFTSVFSDTSERERDFNDELIREIEERHRQTRERLDSFQDELAKEITDLGNKEALEYTGEPASSSSSAAAPAEIPPIKREGKGKGTTRTVRPSEIAKYNDPTTTVLELEKQLNDIGYSEQDLESIAGPKKGNVAYTRKEKLLFILNDYILRGKFYNKSELARFDRNYGQKAKK